MPLVGYRNFCPTYLNPENCYFWIYMNCETDLYLNVNANLIYDCCNAKNYDFRLKFDYRKYIVHNDGFKYGCLQEFYTCLQNLSKLNYLNE